MRTTDGTTVPAPSIVVHEFVDTLYVSPMHQQKQGYQPPNFLPVCENNHNRPNLVLIGAPVIPWR